MTTLPSGEGTPEQRDTEQLKILAIFWYVLSGLQLLFGCGAFFPIGFGVLTFLGMASSGRAEDAAAGGLFGGFFAVIGLFLLFIWWGIAFLNFMVARSLPKRRKRGLCLAMGAIVCLAVPLGTVLGVFTLMVLSRPSVKAMSL